MLKTWILSPLIGGVIGLFTNWLAIKMLFRPHYEKRAFGMRLPFTPGLIPKERDALSKKIGQTLQDKVFTREALERALLESGVAEKLWEELEAWIGGLCAGGVTVRDALAKALNGAGESAAIELAKKLAPAVEGSLPKISAYVRELDKHQPEADAALRQMAVKVAKDNLGGFVGIFVNFDKIYDNIKNSLCDYLEDPQNGFSEKAGALLLTTSAGILDIPVGELLSKLPGGLESMKPRVMDAASRALEYGGARLAESLDIADIAVKQLNAYEIAEAEQIIVGVVSKELRMITWLGGLLGVIIGFATPLINTVFK